MRLNRRPSQPTLVAATQGAILETGPARNQGDGCGNSRHAVNVLCWTTLEVGPKWAGLFLSTRHAPGKLPTQGVARVAGDAVAAQTQLILFGCFILIAFVVQMTPGAEAEKQDRDRYEQSQQEDKL